MKKKNRNVGLECLVRTAVGTLIGIGAGYVANQTDCISHLIEYFGGKAGSFDSVLEFGIPTAVGLFRGWYSGMSSITRRNEEARKNQQQQN